MQDPKHYFVCGIGGSGMLPIARLLKAQGHKISGSDRAYDRGETIEKFSALKIEGLALNPQDGSGVDESVDYVVASAAVEDKIPDVAKARALNIPVLNKAQVLAKFLNTGNSIGIAGTSGKTTVTGMTGFILNECGLAPRMMNGGHIVNYFDASGQGNALCGDGEWFVCETDESDNSVSSYAPLITIINNITLDHKPLEELRHIFRDLGARTRGALILNVDDPETAALSFDHQKIIRFGIDAQNADIKAHSIQPRANGSDFKLYHRDSDQNFDVHLNMPGRHNIRNALAAMAAAFEAGISFDDAARALSNFKGIKRRFEVIGTKNNITVIDDFGHNPDKIAATLKTLNETPGRIFAFFQPHGFGPTKLMKDGLIDVFSKHLKAGDHLIMPQIFYAGGTADKSISSVDIIEAARAKGVQAHFMPSRLGIRLFVKQMAIPGDRIVIMGARDDSLPEFARQILSGL